MCVCACSFSVSIAFQLHYIVWMSHRCTVARHLRYTAHKKKRQTNAIFSVLFCTFICIESINSACSPSMNITFQLLTASFVESDSRANRTNFDTGWSIVLYDGVAPFEVWTWFTLCRFSVCCPLTTKCECARGSYAFWRTFNECRISLSHCTICATQYRVYDIADLR